MLSEILINDVPARVRSGLERRERGIVARNLPCVNPEDFFRSSESSRVVRISDSFLPPVQSYCCQTCSNWR